MGQSNDEWGALPDDESRERHDDWLALQALTAVDAPLLTRFLEQKGLSAADLLRVGARWQAPDTLVFFYPEGLKYRRLTDDRRWNTSGTEWKHLKIIRAAEHGDRDLLVVEGETDAAIASRLWPGVEVGVLPAGARGLTQGMVDQCASYERVMVALDADAAGDEGATALLARLPAGRRVRPPDGLDLVEWHQSGGLDGVDDPWDLSTPPPRTVFSLRELFEADLGTFEENHWLEHGILPRRGQLVLHGAVKSLKSWLMIELMRSLCTGTPFAGSYEFLGENPAKCLLFQFEVPPFDFRRRMLNVAASVPDPQHQLLLDNFHVHRLADNQFSRVRMGPEMAEIVGQAAEGCGASIVLFDPFQRMTGAASLDKAHEVDQMFQSFGDLQAAGFTVCYNTHNNKAGGKMSKDPYAMAGTQRLAADVDSVCSLWQSKGCAEDDNEQGIIERNFTWTMRNGHAPGRSIRLVPTPDEGVVMEFDGVIPNTTTEETEGDHADI